MMFLASALPFVGFGFLDNFLMIICGEYIDTTLCVAFSFSTMAAAALGNTISDCAGIFSGGAVESLAAKCGVEEPFLEREQRNMFITKVWQYCGQVIGIIIGCALGCCPLLWLDPKAAERMKKDRERDAIFNKVVSKVAEMLNAEAAQLLFLDEQRGDLVSKHFTINLRPHRWLVCDGFIGRVATTGQFVNVADIQEEPQYDPSLHDDFLGCGITVKSILCMPVFVGGKVAGCISIINKRDEDGHEGVFTRKDEDVISAISTHVSMAMGDDKENFEQVLEGCQRSMCLQGAYQWNTTMLEHRKTLINPMLRGMASFLDAESISIMLVDDVHGDLYTEATVGNIPKHRAKVGLGQSFAGWSVERGVLLSWSADRPEPFQAQQYQNYQNSNVNVRSALCVPIIDNRRKCLGAIECLNKKGDSADLGFDANDIDYVQQVARYLSQMLEGPTAELRRVLKMTRQRQQHKEVEKGIFGSGDGKTVVCFLDQAQDLPKAPNGQVDLDPYVTMHIVHGDPLLEPQEEGFGRHILVAREKAISKASWEFGKSETLCQQRDPKWDESIVVPPGDSLSRVQKHELYLHVLLWDYYTMQEDVLVAQAAVPLAEMPRAAGRNSKPYRLYPVSSADSNTLNKARIWLSCSRV